VSLGLKRENILVTDAKGVVYMGRTEGMDPNKARYARDTSARTLAEIIAEADVFLGLSAGNVLTPAMVKTMARDPIILAMANPTPEIMPEERSRCGPTRSSAPAARTIRTRSTTSSASRSSSGRARHRATTINEAMKLAAVRAIAELTHQEIPEIVAQAYGAVGLRFGRDYLIPKPFDPRLIEVVAPAVAQAAMDSGVATRPIADMQAYRQRLSQFVYQSGSSMQPIFAAAKHAPKRVVYAEGEDERVLRAPRLSSTSASAGRCCWDVPRSSPSASPNSGSGSRSARTATPSTRSIRRSTATRPPTYFGLRRRDGMSLAAARVEVRSRATLLAALLVRQGKADAMLCGTFGSYASTCALCAT
jgi:malate dehydrogenase (oxaloacetate-decarboxylating)(NADP+)